MQLTTNRITNKENNLTQRESILERGELLDEYQYYLNFKSSGAMKMIVLSTMDGFLNIHTCSNCSKTYAPSPITKLAHFKSYVKNGSFSYSDYLSMYSVPFKKEIQLISSSQILLFSTILCNLVYIIQNYGRQ